MKIIRLLLAVAVLAFAPFALAADAPNLTGHWVATQQGPDGQARETSLWLKSDGDRVSGYISTRRGDMAIADGKVMGDRITFAVVTDAFDQTGRTEYSGTITADGIKLTMPAFGRGAAVELLARQVSTEDPKPLPVPAPKIALPGASPVRYNGLAKTPPMGWNSWNQFRAQVSDKLIRDTADAMARNGMKEAGYVYVNIDDTWQGKRDDKGNLQPNDRFPDMRALADYIHSKGMKFGLYSSPGATTCAGYEGSFQHEEQDAKEFAAWGVDYLKYDWCGARVNYDAASTPAVFAKMGEALRATGRPVVYSFSSALPKAPEWAFAAGGNLWRTGSFRDDYASMAADGFETQNGLETHAGPGHWNDPDMLRVGQGGMNDAEYRTHFSLWCMLAAPLLAGNDVRNAPANILAILTNKEAIAIDQDPLGRQGTRLKKEGDTEMWVKPLASGAYAVGLFNRGDAPAAMTARASDLGWKNLAGIRDLWAHENYNSLGDSYSTEVPAHGVVFLKIAGK